MADDKDDDTERNDPQVATGEAPEKRLVPKAKKTASSRNDAFMPDEDVPPVYQSKDKRRARMGQRDTDDLKDAAKKNPLYDNDRSPQ